MVLYGFELFLGNGPLAHKSQQRAENGTFVRVLPSTMRYWPLCSRDAGIKINLCSPAATRYTVTPG
jgi:hypothetical protein